MVLVGIVAGFVQATTIILLGVPVTSMSLTENGGRLSK